MTRNKLINDRKCATVSRYLKNISCDRVRLLFVLVIVRAYRHVTALHNIPQLVFRRRMYVFHSRLCFTISNCVPGSNLSNPQALLLNNGPVSNIWLSGSYIQFNDRFIVSHILEVVPLN
jgi:hypothetical protein